jgi:hypothetical protein
MAAACGHTETVEVLLAAGAEVNVQNKVCTFLQPSAHPLAVSATCVGVRCDNARHGGGGGRQVVCSSPGTHLRGWWVWCRMGGLRFTGRPTKSTR